MSHSKFVEQNSSVSCPPECACDRCTPTLRETKGGDSDTPAGLVLPDLLDLAREAARDTDGDSSHEAQSQNARAFVCEVGTHIERLHGREAADAFYSLLGFRHLLGLGGAS